MVAVWRSLVALGLLAMVQNVGSLPATAATRILTRMQQMMFPDSEEDTTKDDKNIIFTPIYGTPLCARKGSTFCENVDSYPHNYIQKFLKKNSSFNSLFGIDASPDEFANRASEDEDHSMCESEQRLTFPKIGKTKGNTWQYIINQENSPEGYVQGVQIETCKSLDSPCALHDNIPDGYITKCKQKYNYRRLLSVSTNGVKVNEFFEMPSACCCSYKRDYSFLLRPTGLS